MALHKQIRYSRRSFFWNTNAIFQTINMYRKKGSVHQFPDKQILCLFSASYISTFANNLVQMTNLVPSSQGEFPISVT
jgi:hypothetical protein